MNESITVRGYVATDVRSTLAPSGLPIAGFRMCSTERRFDRAAGTWVDGHTNWYSVSMFRQLATNGALSIKKGDRVVVFGRLKVRPWSKDDGRSGTSVEIDAETAGHDLMWGTASFRRGSTEKVERSGDQELPPDGSGDVPDGVDPETGQILEPAGTPHEPGPAEPGTTGFSRTDAGTLESDATGSGATGSDATGSGTGGPAAGRERAGGRAGGSDGGRDRGSRNGHREGGAATPAAAGSAPF